MCTNHLKIVLNLLQFFFSRLHKLVWGPHGVDDQSSSGLLIGGAEQGRLYIWDPAKILSEEDPLVHLLDKHTGAVAALDINPFQVC